MDQDSSDIQEHVTERPPDAELIALLEAAMSSRTVTRRRLP